MREGRWRKIEALPDIFTEALAQTGSLPASAVFIGDFVALLDRRDRPRNESEADRKSQLLFS
jgi:hypothetical protein